MKLTHTIIAFLLMGMLAGTAAAAQHQGNAPADAGPQEQVQAQAQQPDTANQTGDVETNQTGNQSEKPEQAKGKSAQFDARLKVAIDTVSTLVEIAPNKEARTGLQNALETLKSVQENTDTASLGPDSDNESEEAENKSEEAEQEEAERGPETGGPGSANRGGSEQARQKRPGFVNRLVGGLFG